MVATYILDRKIVVKTSLRGREKKLYINKLSDFDLMGRLVSVYQLVQVITDLT